MWALNYHFMIIDAVDQVIIVMFFCPVGINAQFDYPLLKIVYLILKTIYSNAFKYNLKRL